MKMFDKKQMEYKDGYLVCNGEVVSVPNEIVAMANELETDVQKAQFEREHGCNVDPCDGCDEGFARKTERSIPKVRAETPLMDLKAAQALQLMDEIDNLEKSEKVNGRLRAIDPLLQFVEKGFVIGGENPEQMRFDVPVLGNPAEWTVLYVSEAVLSIFGIVDFAGSDCGCCEPCDIIEPDSVANEAGE